MISLLGINRSVWCVLIFQPNGVEKSQTDISILANLYRSHPEKMAPLLTNAATMTQG